MDLPDAQSVAPEKGSQAETRPAEAGACLADRTQVWLLTKVQFADFLRFIKSVETSSVQIQAVTCRLFTPSSVILVSLEPAHHVREAVNSAQVNDLQLIKQREGNRRFIKI